MARYPVRDPAGDHRSWSLASLQIWLLAGWFLLAAGAGQRKLGSAADGVGSGQADFGGPALDDGPEPVARADVAGSSDVRQAHRSNGGVTVEDLTGQPGHLPSARRTRHLPG